MRTMFELAEARPRSDDGVSRWLAVATITDHG